MPGPLPGPGAVVLDLPPAPWSCPGVRGQDGLHRHEAVYRPVVLRSWDSQER